MEYDMKYFLYNKEFDRECALSRVICKSGTVSPVSGRLLPWNKLNYKPTMKLRIITSCGYSAITLISMLIYSSSSDARILDILHVRRIAKIKQENAAINSTLTPSTCIGSNAVSTGKKTTFTEFFRIKSSSGGKLLIRKCVFN